MPKLDGRNMVMVLAPDKRAKAAWEKAQAAATETPRPENDEAAESTERAEPA